MPEEYNYDDIEAMIASSDMKGKASPLDYKQQWLPVENQPDLFGTAEPEARTKSKRKWRPAPIGRQKPWKDRLLEDIERNKRQQEEDRMSQMQYLAQPSEMAGYDNGALNYGMIPPEDDPNFVPFSHLPSDFRAKANVFPGYMPGGYYKDKIRPEAQPYFDTLLKRGEEERQNNLVEEQIRRAREAEKYSVP